MKAVHTPGPWRYEYQDGYCGEIVASNGKEVAAFVDEPNEADARLISAAPELLEALSGVLKIERGTSGRIIIEGWHEEVIRAAIAKATGERT